MLFKISIFSIVVVFSSIANSSIANHSVFPEMKGTNPAVICDRQSATASIYAKADRIKKEQDLSQSFGSDSKGITDIDMKTVNLASLLLS